MPDGAFCHLAVFHFSSLITEHYDSTLDHYKDSFNFNYAILKCDPAFSDLNCQSQIGRNKSLEGHLKI